MSFRRLGFALTAWSVAATVAAAEPEAANGRNAPPAAAKPGLVLASAERSAGSEEGAEAPQNEAQEGAAPVKRQRAARVTTCRCGDRGQ
jgi:hypothetical protein